jgi:hypothetical protein
MKIFQIVGVLMLIAVVGCSSVPVGPGEKPDVVPPKIQISPNNVRSWDRPSAFGPVPSELQDAGNEVCGQFDWKPIGYHPNAQDANGNVFAGGGYLCSPK